MATKAPIRHVDIRQAFSRDEGSCNACTTHTTPDGVAEHRVWVIGLRGCSVRLCDECLAVLRDRLADLDPSPKAR